MASKKVVSFAGVLAGAVAEGVRELRGRIGTEHIYAVALYTSGESDYSYVLLSANTEEGLTRAAERRALEDPSYAGEAGRVRLRWSSPDWAYHDCAENVAALAIPPRTGHATLVAALRNLDEAGTFGNAGERARITLLVTCGDMSEAFFRRGLERLNPPAVIDAYVRDYTPDGLVAEIEALPPDQRADTWIGLFEDLSLDTTTRVGVLSARARASSLSHYDVAERLGRVPGAAPRLVDLIERHGFGRTFNTRGTREFDREGAFTREDRLATSAVFVLGEMKGVDEETIERLQDLLARRLEIDRAVSPTSTLAENIARVLHGLRPRRFPPTVLDGRTNHLRNPGAYLK